MITTDAVRAALDAREADCGRREDTIRCMPPGPWLGTLTDVAQERAWISLGIALLAEHCVEYGECATCTYDYPCPSIAALALCLGTSVSLDAVA